MHWIWGWRVQMLSLFLFIYFLKLSGTGELSSDGLRKHQESVFEKQQRSWTESKGVTGGGMKQWGIFFQNFIQQSFDKVYRDVGWANNTDWTMALVWKIFRFIAFLSSSLVHFVSLYMYFCIPGLQMNYFDIVYAYLLLGMCLSIRIRFHPSWAASQSYEIWRSLSMPQNLLIGGFKKVGI